MFAHSRRDPRGFIWTPATPARLCRSPGAWDSNLRNRSEGEVYVAVDEGVLIKTGQDVLVSVRNAIVGTDLSQLREAVKEEFLPWTKTSKNPLSNDKIGNRAYTPLSGVSAWLIYHQRRPLREEPVLAREVGDKSANSGRSAM